MSALRLNTVSLPVQKARACMNSRSPRRIILPQAAFSAWSPLSLLSISISFSSICRQRPVSGQPGGAHESPPLRRDSPRQRGPGAVEHAGQFRRRSAPVQPEGEFPFMVASGLFKGLLRSAAGKVPSTCAAKPGAWLPENRCFPGFFFRGVTEETILPCPDCWLFPLG